MTLKSCGEGTVLQSETGSDFVQTTEIGILVLSEMRHGWKLDVCSHHPVHFFINLLRQVGELSRTSRNELSEYLPL